MKRRFVGIKYHPICEFPSFHEEYGEADIGNLARQIGIDYRALKILIYGPWNRIDLLQLQQVLTFFKLTVADVLKPAESDFWGSIQNAGVYTMSRHGARGDSFTGVWNEKASAKLYTFIKEKVGVSRVTRTDGAESDHKYEGNVFAFGSKNIHSEILICEAFGAKPFDPSTQNREMIPFSFRYPKERLNDYPSTICIAENNPERWGICGADGNPLIQIPYLEEYQESESKSAEGAVILAAPRKHDSSAKLVVLAGYSGPGTEAAAEMLLLTFHQFESVDSMPVWGVLSTEWFQKPGRADQRTLTKKRAWIRRPGP